MHAGKSRAVATTTVSVALIFACVWVLSRLAPESAPIARGAAYAGVRGCVDCHGDPDKTQPDANKSDCSEVNDHAWHPSYGVSCSDAMSYFAAIRLRRSVDERTSIGFQNPLIAGELLARKYHCFQCHGELGQGGFANAGSLKGYVPGYFGNDFKLLTQQGDPVSIRSWIENGMDGYILREPLTGRIAKFFFARQAVSMPSFRSLPEEEIQTLVSYVQALSSYGPMTAATVRAYGEQSRYAAIPTRSAKSNENPEGPL